MPDSDKAAGVLLVLSNRAADCLMSSGGDEIPGGRIVWARLEGAQVNTFVVAAYVPYEDHQKNPFQCDVINQIDKTIEKNSRSGDQIIVMMDANSRLKRGLSGYTGKWAVHKKSDKGGIREANYRYDEET